MSQPQTPRLSSDGVITHTTKKLLLTTPNPFEKRFGYHRAVRRGPCIYVSGTTAVELVSNITEVKNQASNPKVRYPGDAYKQAEFAMQRCQEAVKALGGTKEDIVRVKMYVAKYEDCSAIGDAFRAVMSNQLSGPQLTNDVDTIGAAATMIVVPGGFVDEEMLVEVEVDAYCL